MFDADLVFVENPNAAISDRPAPDLPEQAPQDLTPGTAANRPDSGTVEQVRQRSAGNRVGWLRPSLDDLPDGIEQNGGALLKIAAGIGVVPNQDDCSGALLGDHFAQRIVQILVARSPLGVERTIRIVQGRVLRVLQPRGQKAFPAWTPVLHGAKKTSWKLLLIVEVRKKAGVLRCRKHLRCKGVFR